MSAVRVGISDGLPIRTKTCRTCGHEGVCTDGSDSEFAIKERKSGRVASWHPDCKPCSNAKQREHRARDAERMNAEARRRYRARLSDPEFVRRKRERHREAQRRRWADPEKRAKMQERSKLYHRRRKKADPEGVNEEHRLYYALRAERAGREVKRFRTVIDGTRPRALAEPFRAWLVAYRDLAGCETDASLARELGISERRVRSVLAREYEQVAFDVVDRALTNARIIVGGTVTIDDLYAEEASAA